MKPLDEYEREDLEMLESQKRCHEYSHDVEKHDLGCPPLDEEEQALYDELKAREALT